MRAAIVVTLRSEGLSTEVTLERPLAAVHAQMHVQVVLLGEGMAAQVAHKRSLVSARESQQTGGKRIHILHVSKSINPDFGCTFG